IVQAGKTAGSLRIEATSPGLTSALATIGSKPVKLRAQVAAWERDVPTGTGVTGLWRRAVVIADAQTGNPMALAGGNTDAVYTFRQDGNTLTGKVEMSDAGGGGGRGGPLGGQIEDGKVEGSNVSFRAGTVTYTGTIGGEQIELRQAGAGGGRGGRGGAVLPAETGPVPAIGPPPAGTDPSFGAGGGGRGRSGAQTATPIVLRRSRR
ncbi:MAG TPA: hypothetical protein VFC21_00440, partial [Bryobacteraceae bacterium]|nr:hypothetical protein [Bryobacteraceae bacterium]